MFDIQVSLCERYPALNILDMRQRPAHEVFLLFKRTLDYQHRNDKSKPKVIKRKAGDNWF